MQLGPHLPARVRIERGHRLVEQEHLRPASERARERDALALTAGQLGRLRLGEVLDLQPPQQPVRARTAEGVKVVPLKVLKAVLPDPLSLAPNYTGYTCIGDLVKGKKDGEYKEIFIYNNCDHAACFKEVESQAISYTAGVCYDAARQALTHGSNVSNGNGNDNGRRAEPEDSPRAAVDVDGEPTQHTGSMLDQFWDQALLAFQAEIDRTGGDNHEPSRASHSPHRTGAQERPRQRRRRTRL